jgi:hypothetical protein
MSRRFRFPEKEDFLADAALFSLRVDEYCEAVLNDQFIGLSAEEADKATQDFFRPEYPASENFWRSSVWAGKYLWYERPVTLGVGLLVLGIIVFLNVYFSLKSLIL